GTIHDAIAEGAYYGLQSFDQSLLQLVLDKAVTIEEAMSHASSKQNFALLLEANDVRVERDVRRVASGSQQKSSIGDLVRAAPVAVPMVEAAVPAAAAAPTMSPFGPAAAAQPQHGVVGDFLPQIGGQQPGQAFTFPGVAPAATTQYIDPQQPRPQPGISPDLGQGHSAA
ncbi:MAG: hypothetical protein JWO69_25, partial [Thermoleophilia bacterium]|nr:hypothetical protein [Thermoleophilia bacterium]